MDNFVEQLVTKKRTASDTIFSILVAILAILIPVGVASLANIISAYFIYIALFLFLFTIYGAWLLITSRSLEYEYSVLKNELIIDKIIAKRKRKKVIAVDIKNLLAFDKPNSKVFNNINISKEFMLASDIDAPDTYAIIFNSPDIKGNCLILFSPNEKTIAAMKPYLKHELQKQFLSN